MIRDPVCGMEIEEKDAAATREMGGQTIYFCSDSCAEKFDADPHAYLHHEEAPMIDSAGLVEVGSATTGVNPTLTGPVQAEMPIVNLDCATCVVTVQRTLEEMDGVQKAVVNFATAKAFVDYDPERVTLDDMAQAIKKAGYSVGGTTMRLGIEGLRCASCVGFIEEALRATPGVQRASVNVNTAEATVDYLPSMTDLAQLKAAIASTGYTAIKALSDEPVDAEREAREKEYRDLRNRFVVAAVLAAAVLALAFARFIPVLSAIPQQANWIIQFVLTTPVLF